MVKASVGRPAAKLTRPSTSARSVSELSTHPCAITCIQVPVSEMAEPMM
jgi:hypothetical protein